MSMASSGPSTGQSWWGLLPTVSTEAMTVALATFAQDEGIDADHRVVLVVDQAGWHSSRKVVLPEGMRRRLPAASLPGVATGRAVVGPGR